MEELSCFAKKVDGYPDVIEGYLAALSSCYWALKQELSLAEISFPWEERGDDVSSTTKLGHDSTSERLSFLN